MARRAQCIGSNADPGTGTCSDRTRRVNDTSDRAAAIRCHHPSTSDRRKPRILGSRSVIAAPVLA